MTGVIEGAIISALLATGAVSTLGGLIAVLPIVGALVPVLVPLGASLALSAVSSILLSPKKSNTSISNFEGRNQSVRQPISARRIIYGEVRVSGIITFLHVTNEYHPFWQFNFSYLHILLTLSGHEVEEIGAVYFDDELVPINITGSNLDGTAIGKYAQAAVILKGLGTTAGDAWLNQFMQANTGGLWTADHKQEGCAKLYVRLLFFRDKFPNGLPNITCMVKGKKVYDPRDRSTRYSANPALCIRDYLTNTVYGLGDPKINDTQLIASANVCDEFVTIKDKILKVTEFQASSPTQPLFVQTGWHPGRGQATSATNWILNVAGTYKYAYTFYDETGETLPGPQFIANITGSYSLGIPVSKINVGPPGTTGRKVYRTTRNGSQLKLATTITNNITTSFNDLVLNSALGANAPVSQTTLIHNDLRLVDPKNVVITTMQPVTLTTTGTLPTPLATLTTYYAIRTENGTYKLATTEENARLGVEIDITTLGSGEHSIIDNTEIRYQCNGTIDTDEIPKVVIPALSTAMMGENVPQDGKWNIYAGSYRTPEVEITESDLDGPIVVTTKVARREIFNRVKGVFIAKDQFYEQTDFPPVTNELYLSEDQNEQIWKDIALPFTTSASMAQRIAKIELTKSRQQITVTLQLKLSMLKVKVADVVMLTFTKYGWIQKPFEVVSFKISARTSDSEGPRLGIDIVCRETAPGVYDWNVGEETTIDLAPNTELPDGSKVAPPGNPVVEEVLYQTTLSAGVKSKAIVTWGRSDDGFIDHYQVDYKQAQSEIWLEYPDIKGTFVELRDLETVYYDFRVRAYNGLNVPSPYSNEVRAKIDGLSAPPTAITGLTITAIASLALAEWDLSVDLDVRQGGMIAIRHSPLVSVAKWEDGRALVSSPGNAVQKVLPLMTGTYMVKAKDSTGHFSTTTTSFVATEGALTGFNTVATITEHTAFSGTKTNLEVVSNKLKLTDPTVNKTGIYDFNTVDDRTSAATRRYESDVKSLAYVADDLIDSRLTNIDTWANFDGDQVNGCGANLEISTTNDDPGSSPSWGVWIPLTVGEFNCRATRFRLKMSCEDDTTNIEISELVVHVKEAA